VGWINFKYSRLIVLFVLKFKEWDGVLKYYQLTFYISEAGIQATACSRDSILPSRGKIRIQTSYLIQGGAF